MTVVSLNLGAWQWRLLLIYLAIAISVLIMSCFFVLNKKPCLGAKNPQ
ncbi:MAG: hypothetical protein F6K18_23660 [Okeania sp. SIO2C2]|nr:hypothetical protein [Okeania sp. SIO2C2]NEP89587.1 hypothetical protein [Okeania sp. SIO2C2]